MVSERVSVVESPDLTEHASASGDLMMSANDNKFCLKESNSSCEKAISYLHCERIPFTRDWVMNDFMSAGLMNFIWVASEADFPEDKPPRLGLFEGMSFVIGFSIAPFSQASSVIAGEGTGRRP